MQQRMIKYTFEAIRTYTWNIEIKVPSGTSEEEAKELMLEREEFDENSAQQSHIEVVDCKKGASV